MKRKMDELKNRLSEIYHLGSILALTSWDQEVNMPIEGALERARSISRLSAVIHGKLIKIDSDKLLSKLNHATAAGKIRGPDAVIVSETWRNFERERKLPEEFVCELSETCSKAQGIWAKARKDDNFKLFLPWLEKIVALKRREAEYVGYKECPYDALLNLHEPGMTAKEAQRILAELKEFLVPFIKKIRKGKGVKPARLWGKFPMDCQKKFNEYVSKSIGFDFKSGRLDVSTHPFASGLNPRDVRLTTRYRKKDILYSLFSTIHETGHGLYEQGLPAGRFGTPLAEAVSLGIHESQSRMWENIIGRSRPFWRHFYPKLQKEFPLPFKKIPLNKFYGTINRVQPSLIRTESDEVTYNLHIILRFEIEKAMIEGKIRPNNLPKIWKEKMREYLGLEVPNDTMGVLQDVHWSVGAIGYFPTYSFGNLYSAQFFKAMKRDMPNIDKKIARGEFAEINAWLRKNIHSLGKTYRANELVKKVTGEDLNSRYFMEYLEEKYGKML